MWVLAFGVEMSVGLGCNREGYSACGFGLGLWSW